MRCGWLGYTLRLYSDTCSGAFGAPRSWIVGRLDVVRVADGHLVVALAGAAAQAAACLLLKRALRKRPVTIAALVLHCLSGLRRAADRESTDYAAHCAEHLLAALVEALVFGLGLYRHGAAPGRGVSGRTAPGSRARRTPRQTARRKPLKLSPAAMRTVHAVSDRLFARRAVPCFHPHAAGQLEPAARGRTRRQLRAGRARRAGFRALRTAGEAGRGRLAWCRHALGALLGLCSHGYGRLALRADLGVCVHEPRRPGWPVTITAAVV
jgi:hypothetical protein